jgi:pentatricopeptide repeat protein
VAAQVINLLMDACVRAGQFERADKLFLSKASLGVTADQHTWNTLMRARAQLSESSVEVRSSCKPMQN